MPHYESLILPDPCHSDMESVLREATGPRNDQDPGFGFVHVQNPSPDELNIVGKALGLQQLQIEDSLNPQQRPKWDVTNWPQIFVVMKTFNPHEVSEDFTIGQISIFAAAHFVVVVELGNLEQSSFQVQWQPSASSMPSTLVHEHGPLGLAHFIIDSIVDGYLDTLDRLAEAAGAVENAALSMSNNTDVSRLVYEIQRKIMTVRNAVNPLTIVAHDLAQESLAGMSHGLSPYFRDIGEHILRAHEGIEAINTSLMTILMVNTSMMDLRQNSDMRKISSWVAIAAVPAVVGGIYGMNFRHMPELDWQWSYPVLLATVAVVCFGLYRGFKKSGWL